MRKPKEKQSCLLGDEVRVFLCPTHQDDNYSYAWKCEVPNPKSSCEECALSTRTLTFKSFSEEDEDTYTCTVKYRDTFTETVSIKLVQKGKFSLQWRVCIVAACAFIYSEVNPPCSKCLTLPVKM